MEKSKLQSRKTERWWQIRSSIARSVELAQNLWNRKLQLNTLVFLSMRDQSNSNRTVYSTHVKTALSRWQLENSWILSRSLLGAIGSPNCAAPGRNSREGQWDSTARALDTDRERGQSLHLPGAQLGPSSACKGSISTSTPRAPSQGLPLFSSGLLLHHTPLTSEWDSPQDSVNRFNIPQKTRVHTHTHPSRKLKFLFRAPKLCWNL